MRTDRQKQEEITERRSHSGVGTAGQPATVSETQPRATTRGRKPVAEGHALRPPAESRRRRRPKRDEGEEEEAEAVIYKIRVHEKEALRKIPRKGGVCESGGEAEEGNILITARGERGEKRRKKRGKKHQHEKWSCLRRGGREESA